jgi:hypothetical protein
LTDPGEPITVDDSDENTEAGDENATEPETPAESAEAELGKCLKS